MPQAQIWTGYSAGAETLWAGVSSRRGSTDSGTWRNLAAPGWIQVGVCPCGHPGADPGRQAHPTLRRAGASRASFDAAAVRPVR